MQRTIKSTSLPVTVILIVNLITQINPDPLKFLLFCSYFNFFISSLWGFPDSSVGKNFTCNAGDLGLIPGLGRSPGEGKGYPLQYSGLEKSMVCIVYGVTKSQTWLGDFHFHFLLLTYTSDQLPPWLDLNLLLLEVSILWDGGPIKATVKNNLTEEKGCSKSIMKKYMQRFFIKYPYNTWPWTDHTFHSNVSILLTSYSILF